MRNRTLRWPVTRMDFNGQRRILTILRPVRDLRETGGTVLSVQKAAAS